MNLLAADEILEAAAHIPQGATLIVPEVSWENFERIADVLDEQGLHRLLSYDCGTLEIVAKSNRHEGPVRFFDRLVNDFARIRKITVEMVGETLWTKRALAKGVMADCCYFITTAKVSFVSENFGWDVETGPPPDIAVEIDITSKSLRKLSIYAALLVPEIWRYDGRVVQIYKLDGQRYVEVDESGFLPGLTGEILSEHLELSREQNQTKSLERFARRIRKL